MKRLKGILDVLVYGNLYVAIPIALLAFSSYSIFGTHLISLELIALIFFSTLFLYPMHRLLSLYRIQPEAYSLRLKIAAKFKGFLFMVVVLAAIGTAYFGLQISEKVFYSFIPLGILSLGYSIPFIPSKKRLLRIRDLPGIKVFAIGFVVSFVTVIVPILNGIEVLNVGVVGLYFLIRMLFIVAITLPFDIRDMKLDRKENIKTIPLIIGKKNTLKLARGLIVLSIVLTLLLPSVCNVAYVHSSFLLMSLVLTGFVLMRMKDFERGYFNAFVLEGMMIVQAIALISADLLMIGY